MWIICVLVSCVSHAFASVHCCLVVTCLERADLLALVGNVYCILANFPYGILGQVWYLIVSFPDLCRLSCFLYIHIALIWSIKQTWDHIKLYFSESLLGTVRNKISQRNFVCVFV